MTTKTDTSVLALKIVHLNAFIHDMAEDGWTLLEDVPLALGENPQFDLAEFLKDGETLIGGEEMRRRAKDLKAHLGQQHAELLLAHQDQIPEDWQKFHPTFPGTVWQDGHGCNVMGLSWDGGRWYLDFRLFDVWHSDDRLVRLRE